MAGVHKVLIHPVALFGIIDTYERRHEDAKRVIGTLVGSYDKGVVEVKNCFTVPHHESQEEVAIEMDYASNMYDLHRRASPSDEIVGWFATNGEVTEHSVLIHEYYSRETACPIHLTVDTTLKSGKLGIKSFVSSSMGVPGGTMGTMFTPVPCEITCYEPEAVAINDFMINKGGSKRPYKLRTSVQHVSSAISALTDRLQKVINYINNVLNCTVPPDNEAGRYLMDIVGSIPQMDTSEVESMMNTNMQDLLMVLYLGSLTKTQLSVGTKINGVI